MHHPLQSPVDLRHGGHAHRQVVDRQPRIPDDARLELRAERLPHLLPLGRGEPVGEIVLVRDIHPDRLRVPLPHDLGEHPPLAGAPELGALAGRRRQLRPVGRVQAAHRAATQRDTLHAVGLPPVEEDVDCAPPRGEARRRDQGAEDWVFVVLPHRDDPHVDAVVAHHLRQVHLEPFPQPGLLHRRLLPQRPERAGRHVGRRRLRPGSRAHGWSGPHQDERCGDQ